MIVSFNDDEEQMFQLISEWLSKKLSCIPTTITEQGYDFTIDPFARTFIDKTGKSLYLTAKEIDLLYFLYSHQGQVFTKEQLYENIGGYDYAPDAKNLSSFIGRLRKKVDPDKPQYIMTVLGAATNLIKKSRSCNSRM